MPTRQTPINTPLYRDVMEFMHNDLCAFLMRRLSVAYPLTYQHSVRVALHSLSIADKLGFGDLDRETFLRSVLLHDIGWLDETGEDHCIQGAVLVQDFIDRGWVSSDILLYHHENLDGSGFPFGKTEKELDLPVRIVRVTDSYDRMTCSRGFSAVRSSSEALEELYRWSDISYDAKVIECLKP